LALGVKSGGAASGLESGVNLLATADPHFDTIPGITVFTPHDL